MKPYILAVFSILFIVACKKNITTTPDDTTLSTSAKQDYTIVGETNGFSDGTKVYVHAISFSNRPVIVDSTVIKNGKFSIALPPVEQKDLNYLTFNNDQGNVLFLAENHPIHMTIYKDSLRASKIKGGKENDLFFQYVAHVNEYPKAVLDINNKIHIATKLKEEDKRTALEAQREKLVSDDKDKKISLIQNNPSFITPVLILLDMLRQNAVTAKEAKGLFSKLDTEIQETRLGKSLAQTIAATIGKIDIGSEAENFTAPTPSGKMLSLKEAMGKVTIIDFWASWCRPCRLENPHVVDVYDKYHDKGLNIIGVSLDGNKALWEKAIQDDHLTWHHVSNLQKWQGPIVKTYGVRSIPATFILDENGIVIAKNLRGEELTRKISELLD